MVIFAELKRRNVFRVALLYVVAAWLVLQMSDFLFVLVGFPAWVFRFVFALLLICLPLVLVFSWVFEITPEGIKREQSVESQSSITHLTAGKINRITLVLIGAAILIAVVDRLIGG